MLHCVALHLVIILGLLCFGCLPLSSLISGEIRFCGEIRRATLLAYLRGEVSSVFLLCCIALVYATLLWLPASFFSNYASVVLGLPWRPKSCPNSFLGSVSNRRSPSRKTLWLNVRFLDFAIQLHQKQILLLVNLLTTLTFSPKGTTCLWFTYQTYP